MIRIGVIVSTYQRPDALRAVLAGLAAQSHHDFDIIVADDGSAEPTRQVVEAFSAETGFPAKHVRHEDQGFRLAKIRNRAIAATHADYLVFLDGDCIAPQHFVKGHLKLAQRGFFVRGVRVRMNQALTEEALIGEVLPHAWTRTRWFREWRRGRLSRFFSLLRVPLGPLRTLRPREWRRVTGCNLAVWREDLIAVNGFDETFSGWGYEDFDLVVRLIRHGVRRKDGRYAVPVLHLWHPEEPRGGANLARFEARVASEETRAIEGIDQYL